MLQDIAYQSVSFMWQRSNLIIQCLESGGESLQPLKEGTGQAGLTMVPVMAQHIPPAIHTK